MKFKDFFHKMISEDGIDALELKGDWTNDKAYGWDKPSRRLLTSDKGVERMRRLWSKTSQVFDLYMMKAPKVHNQVELGQVDYYFVRDKLGLDIPVDDEHITVIYTNNKGAEKVPATPWTLAHRFGHALARKNGMGGQNYAYNEVVNVVKRFYNDIAKNYYNVDLRSLESRDYQAAAKVKRELGHALGTFKSARDRNLRNEFEFVNELFAQYIVTGDIKFNRDPARILPTKSAWGRASGPVRKQLSDEQKIELEDTLEMYERDIYYYVEQAVDDAIGNIYVM